MAVKRDPGDSKTGKANLANELERQKAFLGLLVEAIPSPVFYKNAEGFYVGCNKAFEEYIGLPREEIIGKSVFDMSPRDLAGKYAEMDAELFEKPGKQSYEWKLKDRSGQVREVLFHKASIPGPDGKIVGLIGIITDITERKLTEEALKESESRLRGYIENAPVGMFVADEGGRYLDVNPEACRITGYSREELLSMSIPDLVPPDHLDQSLRSFRDVTETGRSYNELPFAHKDGSIRHWSVNAVRISPDRFMAFVQDITERRRMEDELRVSEARLKRSQQIAHVGSWEYEMKTGNIWGSDEGFRIYGMTPPPSNLLEIDQIEACIPEKKMVHQALVDLIENNKPYDLEFVVNPADGSPQRTVVSKAEITRDPNGEAVKVCGVLKDVTDKKQTENALRESEYRNNLAGKLASFGWWAVDLATNRSTWSDEVAAIHEMPLGYSPIVEDGINFYAPEYRAKITEVVQRCAQEGISYDEEMQIITKSGRRVWVRTIGMAQRDDRGRIVGLLGGFQDISRRKQVEEDLREQRWRLESIIEGANVATWEWNVETGETKFNETWAQMIGYTLDELSPVSIATWEKLSHPEDLKKATDLLESHFEGKLPYYDCEIRMKHRDGRWIWVHGRGRLITRTADGKPLMMFGTHIDINEKKNATIALQTERNWLQHYLDTAGAVVVTLDESGSITMLNSYGLELLGYEKEAILGKNWFDMVLPQPEGMERVYPVFQKIVKGDLSAYGYFENEVVTASGERRLLAWRNNCLNDADGHLIGLLSVGLDITEVRRTEQNYRVLFREMLSGFALHEIICGEDGKPVDYRFLDVNPAFERMTGLRSEGLLGRTVLEVLPETEPIWIETYGRVALTGEPVSFENYSQEFDKYFEVSAYCPAPNHFACIFRDITESKRAEAEIIRANRLYSFISEINQMVVRERERDMIFSESCRIAVEYGKFRMAWIGLVNAEDHTVEPFAWSGVEEEYLSRANRISADNIPEGNGPTGTAIREGKIFCCNDIDKDPRMDPWREEALRRGYRASIALPLKVFGEVIGAFNLYAPETDVFNESEMRLLEEVTGDIAYALEMLENEDKRKQAEDTLKESETRLKKSQQMAHVGSWEYDIKTENIWASDEGFRIFGMAPPPSNLLVVDEIEACIPEKKMVHQALMDLIDVDKPYDLEYEVCPANGLHARTIISKAEVLRDQNGEPVKVSGVMQDITDRKMMEVSLMESEKKLGSIFRNMTDVVWTADLDLKTNFISPSVEILLGESAEKYLKRDLEEKFPSQSMDTVKSILVEELRKEKDPNCDRNRSRIAELEYYRADGTTVWVEMNMSFVRDENGSAIGVQGMTRDITERKHTEEKLRRAVQTTIQVLTQTVERRDPYTAGHQRRVAGLAKAIATEMGLDPEHVESITIAGYVHDIGKISVPAEILSKPGRLSEVEMNLIKEHPVHGREILMNVESTIQLDEVVYQHHERMDGSGYPRGLKGKEILLEARILAVADVVEAMSSHRPYRASRGLKPALEEIENNRGILFCPDAVDACLRLFREKGYVLEE